mmetsp:Transcript_80920/g.217018  ORF Transcript_80920/g.217018 Transcript_80920/m.217018 type:complete len:137 (-) Transcript_80920:756-1166(-)
MRRSAPSERNEVLGIQGLRANRNLFQIIVEGCKPIPETKLNLDGISFAELFTSLRDVLELYLFRRAIGDDIAAELSKELFRLSQLQKLNLEGNRIRDAGAAALSKGLAKLSQLQHLSLVCSWNVEGEDQALWMYFM